MKRHKKKMKNYFIKLLFIVLVIINNSFYVSYYCQGNTFELNEIAYSDIRWTGVAVSNEGRIFVNFPRWSPVPFSVAEIVDSQLVPYPDEEWNNWGTSTPPHNHFVCVQSVYIDKENYLWVLDPASIGGSVVQGGAKLLKIDLSTDSIIQTIYFNDEVAPVQSYLNDIRVDTEEDYAYITDSSIGAIIVIDLNTGESRRLLASHFSTKAENISLIINGQTINFVVHSDGLALTNDRNYLYYKALTGYSLYRINTQALKDTLLTNNELEQEVEFISETLPCDAIEFDPDDYLYFTSIQDNSIYRMLPGEELSLVVSDDRLKWPDSFSITSSGDIYVTTSRIYFPAGEHGLFQINRIASDVKENDMGSVNKFKIYENYPNPFNPSTSIKYQIPQALFVTLKVYDVLGNDIATIVNEEKSAGEYNVEFSAIGGSGSDGNAWNLPSGVYFYQLRAGNPSKNSRDSFVETKKMVLLR
jgi:sugar lactone lactonase YvrE